METLTVVYFTLEEEGRGKKRRRAKWEYHVDEESLPDVGSGLMLFTVHLPFYQYRRKEWTAEKFAGYFQGLPIPFQSREVYYLYHEKAQNFLGRKAEPVSFDWLLFWIDYYRITFDALVIFKDAEIEMEDLIRRYVKDTRYIGIVAREDEGILEMREDLFQEYGFLLDVAEDIKKLHIPAGRKTLVVAGEELHGATPALFREGVFTWITTGTNGKEGSRLCARAKNVRYIDMKTFLRAIRP